MNWASIKRIAAKEMSLFFSSPIGYLFLAVFLAFTLFVFFWVEAFFARNIADVRPMFEWLPLLLLFLCSALTMRMWSEERRSGTLEFVSTVPVSTWSFVLGKFFACWLLLAIALLLTLPLPLTVAYLGNLDWGPVLARLRGGAAARRRVHRDRPLHQRAQRQPDRQSHRVDDRVRCALRGRQPARYRPRRQRRRELAARHRHRRALRIDHARRARFPRSLLLRESDSHVPRAERIRARAAALGERRRSPATQRVADGHRPRGCESAGCESLAGEFHFGARRRYEGAAVFDFAGDRELHRPTARAAADPRLLLVENASATGAAGSATQRPAYGIRGGGAR